MLDPNVIAQMVEQEIRTAVNQQVQQAVSQTAWIQDLENQIVQFVQDRIVARFSNIGTVPDLVDTVERSVAQMFEQGFVPDLASYVDSERVRQTVDQAVEKFAQDTISSLSVDQRWLDKIQTQIEQHMVDRVAASLRDIDLNVTLKNIVLDNKDAITDELRREFFTAGMQDMAKDLQLSVMDGIVVVENELTTTDLTVERNTHLKGDLLINGDLAVQGRINTDNKSWQDLGDHIGQVAYNKFRDDFADELIGTVINEVKKGVEISDVTVNGTALVNGDTLGSGIQSSSLTQLGTLKELAVAGKTSLTDTVTVIQNRVGINTQEPDSALTVWDEEVTVSAGKLSKNTAFVGTPRTQNLVLGTNRQNHLQIDTTGLTTVQKLRVGKNIIGHGKTVPNYEGNKGDIVFNLDMTPEAPFAWICLGAFRWQALKASK
jgi:hypothetical protein